MMGWVLVEMTFASATTITNEVPNGRSNATRNHAVDAYRGFVMFLMLAEVLEFPAVSRAFPRSSALRFLAYNQTHVPWTGASLHDLIQPSFTFLVGMALVYSIRSRLRKGANFRQMLGHTVLRSLVLIVLGVALRVTSGITFLDTLSQIGLGYTFAFLVALRPPRIQWILLASLLFFYWLAWAVYPLPRQPVVQPGWHEIPLAGFAAHWNKGSNLGLAFDRLLLNALPHKRQFDLSQGGYVTLNFVPTLGTMILGSIAGRWAVRPPKQMPLARFLFAATALTAVGLLLHLTGLCPIVKRIWTPSWVLFSGGACFLLLTFFCWLDRIVGRKALFPLVVIGMNSLVAYLLVPLWGHFVNAPLQRYGNLGAIAIFGAFQPLAYGFVVLAVFWTILYLLYRQQIFIRL